MPRTQKDVLNTLLHTLTGDSPEGELMRVMFEKQFSHILDSNEAMEEMSEEEFQATISQFEKLVALRKDIIPSEIDTKRFDDRN